MSEKINSNQQHPEKSRMLVERLGMEIDKPMALTAEEVEQIQKELGGATFSALAAFLEGKWDEEKYRKKKEDANGRYTPDTYFDVNSHVRIDPGGGVQQKRLVRATNASVRNDGKNMWKLEWYPTRGPYPPGVHTLANDLQKLRERVELAETNGQPIPSIVQKRFLDMKSEYEEREAAFEQGREFIGTFQRTSLRESYSAPSAEEEIKLNIRLKNGADPSDPKSWRIDNESCVDSVKKLNDQIIVLEFSTSEGDETGGIELKGNLTVDVATGEIQQGELRQEENGPDGGYEAKYNYITQQ